MSNLVYIVLEYKETTFKGGQPKGETCRVHDVYGNLKKALKRQRFLARITTDSGTTYHVIKKRLKSMLPQA